MLTPLYVAPCPSWSIARTVGAYAQRRGAALERHSDGTFVFPDDAASYRVARFWNQECLGFAWGVYVEPAHA